MVAKPNYLLTVWQLFGIFLIHENCCTIPLVSFRNRNYLPLRRVPLHSATPSQFFIIRKSQKTPYLKMEMNGGFSWKFFYGKLLLMEYTNFLYSQLGFDEKLKLFPISEKLSERFLWKFPNEWILSTTTSSSTTSPFSGILARTITQKFPTLAFLFIHNWSRCPLIFHEFFSRIFHTCMFHHHLKIFLSYL